MKSISDVQCDLMGEWKEYKISDIGTVVTGNTPPKKDPKNYGGELVWIKPPDLDRKMYVSESEEMISDIGKKKVRLLPKGSVLVSCIGNIGKVAISECELCTNQQINSIIPNKEIVDSVFLYYVIKRMRPYLENIASNAVVPLLNKNDFSKVKIALPPLETQKKIVEILERAEKLKEWRAEADELTDTLFNSYFLDIFGDPIKNPNNFKTESLKDLCQLKSGGTPSRKNKEFFNGDIPWITTIALGPKYIDRKDAVEYITNEAIEKSATKLIPKHSILVGVRVGVGKASINKCDICTNQDIISLINIDKRLNKEFLLQILRYYERFFESQIRGATIKGITSSILKDLKIILPPIELQNQFGTIVENIEKIKGTQKQSKQQINDLFNALMQKAFKGELTC
ncbi:MAG: restriction endonuclease subunit S [Euryarchaeota archaeon]|nr:restriction endonuclease subunit S [Euryarchaeota archaeon]